MTHTVRCAVTLEIEVPDQWGSLCTLGQVYDQANRAALTSVAHAIKASNLKAKIVGKPVATLVIVQEKKRGE
ncbi:hypothetical protein B0T40_09640 [Chromobacterium haemolyticum]|uniref:hypothetical protein n=1 Tax=Chromobacterium haemolyticum TaxID=394935 RepID=UPI0009D92CDC|nr:hypothetical protein [Chromobacterium haemolyticum]OQS36648.1 hypothetical protein B0T40_09640 [Chromobacterium haemolyticum]